MKSLHYLRARYGHIKPKQDIPSLEVIGKRVQSAREGLGLQRNELAYLIDCAPKTITNIERGLVCMDINRVMKIALYTNTSVTHLLG